MCQIWFLKGLLKPTSTPQWNISETLYWKEKHSSLAQDFFNTLLRHYLSIIAINQRNQLEDCMRQVIVVETCFQSNWNIFIQANFELLSTILCSLLSQSFLCLINDSKIFYKFQLSLKLMLLGCIEFVFVYHEFRFLIFITTIFTC